MLRRVRQDREDDRKHLRTFEAQNTRRRVGLAPSHSWCAMTSLKQSHARSAAKRESGFEQFCKRSGHTFGVREHGEVRFALFSVSRAIRRIPSSSLPSLTLAPTSFVARVVPVSCLTRAASRPQDAVHIQGLAQPGRGMGEDSRGLGEEEDPRMRQQQNSLATPAVSRFAVSSAFSHFSSLSLSLTPSSVLCSPRDDYARTHTHTYAQRTAQLLLQRLHRSDCDDPFVYMRSAREPVSRVDDDRRQFDLSRRFFLHRRRGIDVRKHAVLMWQVYAHCLERSNNRIRILNDCPCK